MNSGAIVNEGPPEEIIDQAVLGPIYDLISD